MKIRPALVRVLDGESLTPPPMWLMRQAGRYLPEYRETRRQAGSFLDLCYNPELATEVTLQPMRRFGMDAAILFSDILVVPDALGQPVSYIEGRGPVLEPVSVGSLGSLQPGGAVERLAPIMETVRRVRAELPGEAALIGFCGAPWTVATYMVTGHGTPAQAPARRVAIDNPEGFQELIDLLVDVSAAYLVAQIRAGADVVMIFDSWAGVLDDEAFRRWSMEPTARLVRLVREAEPRARIIAFPKGAGARLGAYAQATGASGYGVDWTLPLPQARAMVGEGVTLQGNLDPLRLAAGGAALDRGVDAILEATAGQPHIFNLGHGITPDVPIEHVERMVARVRGRR